MRRRRFTFAGDRWWRRFLGTCAVVSLLLALSGLLGSSQDGDPGDAATLLRLWLLAGGITAVIVGAVICTLGYRRERRREQAPETAFSTVTETSHPKD